MTVETTVCLMNVVSWTLTAVTLYITIFLIVKKIA